MYVELMERHSVAAGRDFHKGLYMSLRPYSFTGPHLITGSLHRP
jgi:hypothetical protein